MAKEIASRDAMRASIFAAENKKPASTVIKLFGQDIEVRQPTLSLINKIGRKNAESANKYPGIVNILIGYCYIPGTDEKVFDDSDADQLASMPSGQWLNDFNEAVQKLTGLDVKEAEKNSDETA